MPKVTNHLDLQQKQLKNAVIDKLANAPGTPVAGQIYYNTGTNSVFIFDGTGWDKLNDQAMSANDINTALGTITTGEIDFNTTLNMNSRPIIGVSMPTGGNAADNDAATRKYVDDKATAAANGLVVKDSVALLIAESDAPALTMVDVNTATASSSIFSTGVDGGIQINNGDRLLLVGQTNKTQNGFWVVSNKASMSATLTRPDDFRYASEIKPNTFTFVRKGTTYADTQWVMTLPDIGTGNGGVGFAEQTWTQYGSPGTIQAGTGLNKSGNTLSVNTSTIQEKLTASTGITLSGSTISVNTTTIQEKLTASTGISISSGNISVDTVNGYGVRKKVVNTTSGGSNFAAYHNFGTKNVTVSVIDNSNDEVVLADVFADNADYVTVSFDTPTTTNQYRIVIIG